MQNPLNIDIHSFIFHLFLKIKSTFLLFSSTNEYFLFFRMNFNQGWRFLVESGGMTNFPKITLGYFWSPNTQCILSPNRVFWHWKTRFWTCLPLYDVKTEWNACWNGQLVNKLGPQGASSKIIKKTLKKCARSAEN